MPKLNKVNWDEVAASEEIAEGAYPARIDNVEERESKTKPGTYYWNMELTMLEEPHTGRKVWDIFSLQPRALWKLRNLCETLDIDLEGRDDLDTEELVGQEIGVNIVPETYEGKIRTKITGYFKLG